MSRSIYSVLAVVSLIAVAGCGIGDAQKRLRSAVDEKNAELNRCYAEALAQNRNVDGTLEANLLVNTTEGRIHQVEFTGGTGRDASLESCMVDTLTQVRLAEPPPANLKVEYTFQLTPEG
jgi:Tfp pilus assembly protein FimT